LIQNLELRAIFFGIMLAKSKHGTIRNVKVSGDAVQQHNSGNAIHFLAFKPYFNRQQFTFQI
jgi:nitrous oxidase accessory protein NosD